MSESTKPIFPSGFASRGFLNKAPTVWLDWDGPPEKLSILADGRFTYNYG